MSTPSTLEPISQTNFFAGFGNLMQKELYRWWGTRRWWTQILVWLIVINGTLALLLWVVPILSQQETARSGEEIEALPPGRELFAAFHGLLGVIGVIIIAQSGIVGERQSGTAAWILSKPVSRSTFILTKFVSDSLGIFVTVVVAQAIVAYLLEWAATGIPSSVGRYAGASALLTLNLLFYLAFVLMLGTFFRSRGSILGMSFGFFFFQYLLTELGIGTFLPGWLPTLAMEFIAGRPLPSITPIITTVILIAACIAAAIWRFGQEEF
jgi:ABC-2 type transport system permease protein